MLRSTLEVHRWWFHRTGRLFVRPSRPRRTSGEAELNIPKCSWCKRIRLAGVWTSLRLDARADTTCSHFTHGICPDCAQAFRAASGLQQPAA